MIDLIISLWYFMDFSLLLIIIVLSLFLGAVINSITNGELYDEAEMVYNSGSSLQLILKYYKESNLRIVIKEVLYFILLLPSLFIGRIVIYLMSYYIFNIIFFKQEGK